METKTEVKKNAMSKESKLNFSLLTLGQLISVVGSFIFNFAVSLYVLDITNSPAAFSMVLMLGLLPRVFVDIFAGALVDRLNKKLVIVASDILSAVSLTIIMFSINADAKSLVPIVAGNILLSIFSSFFGLGIMSSMPNLFNDESEVMKGNSIAQSSNALAGIVGPILGAILYNNVSIKNIFILNAVSFLVSAICGYLLVFHTNKDASKEKETYFGSIKSGFLFIKSNSFLLFLCMFYTFYQIIASPLVSMILPFITYKVVGLSSFQLSIIETAWAIGTILGAVLASINKSGKQILGKLFVLLQVQALLIIAWMFPRISSFNDVSSWVMTFIFVALLTIIGLLSMYINIPLVSYFQMQVPENMRGRVFGIITALLTVGAPVGMGIFGFLMEKTEWTVGPIVAGLSIIIACLISGNTKTFREFKESLKNEQITG
jgi:MFS family permease